MALGGMNSGTVIVGNRVPFFCYQLIQKANPGLKQNHSIGALGIDQTHYEVIVNGSNLLNMNHWIKTKNSD